MLFITIDKKSHIYFFNSYTKISFYFSSYWLKFNVRSYIHISLYEVEISGVKI